MQGVRLIKIDSQKFMIRQLKDEYLKALFIGNIDINDKLEPLESFEEWLKEQDLLQDI